MLEKFKNIPLMTKILYLFTVVLFLVWFIPSMLNYYSKVNEYDKKLQEVQNEASKYSVTLKTKPFDLDVFKESADALFSKVVVNSKGDHKHKVMIKIKREDIKKLHTFIETLSLRYLVKIEGALKFKADDEGIQASMTLVEL